MIRNILKGHPKKTHPSSKPSEPKIIWLTKIKGWLLCTFVVIFLTCVLLFGVEGTLRFFHIGYAPQFFLKEKKQDSIFCTDNPAFGRRFFPSTLVRRSEKLRFPLHKDNNERRIFILGSSAAQGDPATAFAFSRDLDLLLQGRYESTHCRVINTAITATNSHVVVPIARECSKLSPDIFIVYLGNNEVIGPFGPGTVLSQFSSPWFIRLRIFLSSTRLGQLASTISESIAKDKGIPAGWGGMRMFLQHKIRFDDQRMTRVYQNYRNNLKEMCRAARNSGAHIVLCTVASNIKGCAPFFSMHQPDLSPDALKQWKVYYQQAVDLQSRGQFEAALVLLKRAAILDSTNADMHFRMAQCLDTLGQYKEARQHFIAARDYDGLRFRADSKINQIIKDVAREFPDCAVLLDMDESLSAASDHGICGQDLFLEHVHYNFHGNYLLASGMLPLLDSLIAKPVVIPQSLSEAECRDRLAFTNWEELILTRAVYDRLKKPPFSDQTDNLNKVREFEQKIHWLSSFVADSGQSIFASYQRAVSLEPQDWRIFDLFGRYLLLNDSSAIKVEQAYRKVFSILPHDQFVRFNLALALERQNRIPEAINYYQEAIRIDPLFFDAYVNLADNLMEVSRIEEAERYLKQVLRINPALLSAQERYAQVLLMQKKETSDTLHFDKSIISPEALAIAYNRTALRYLKQGYLQDAIEQFNYAISIYPEQVQAQSNFARVLVKTGKVREGIEHFKKAVRIDPTIPEVRVDFADALAIQGLHSEAKKEYRAALSLNPKMVSALNGLGILLAKQDSLPQAIDLFVRAIEERPSMLSAHRNLIAACKLIRQDSQAIDHLTRLSTQYPQTAEIHYSLGKLLLEQGYTVQAYEQLKVAAQLRPDLPEIEELLSIALSRSNQGSKTN